MKNRCNYATPIQIITYRYQNSDYEIQNMLSIIAVEGIYFFE